MTDPRRPPDSVLARFLSGECSPDEVRAVESWLDDAPTNAQELHHLATAWTRPGEVRDAGPEPDVDVFWHRVRDRIEVPAPPQVRVVTPQRERPAAPTFAIGGRSRWSGIMKVAAAIAIIVGGGLTGRALLEAPDEPAAAPTYSVISTTQGQRLSVRLADGTLVSLAPGTTLRTPSTYGVRHRTVELEGEAAFTVTHDSTRPFAVRTRLAVARDLGTEFIVRAYADEPAVDVVVAEGLVAVGRADSAAGPLSSDSLVISRGDLVRVDAAGRLALTRDVSLDRYFGWTEGRLVFRRTPLREAVAQLERWYDVEIRLGSAGLAEQGVTATFRDTEPAAQVLQVIATVLKLTVVETGDRVYTLRTQG